MADSETIAMTRIMSEHPDIFLKEGARRSLLWFAEWTDKTFQATDFHRSYYRVLDAFAHQKIKKLIVQAPPQHGKLIADSTLVPTPKGLRRHGDLNVGDYVFGRDGKPVKVLWKSEKDKTEYRLTFSNGQTIDCHGAHEWVVRDRYRRKEVTIETRELRELRIGEAGKRGNHLMYHVDAPACIEYAPRYTPIDAYTFGAWLGDGKASEPLIHIGNNDIEIIDEISHSYLPHEQKGTTTRPFYFSELRKVLRPYYNNKHISSEYIYNSVRVRKELIAGLIDTDGYVYLKNGRVTISNTNERIIKAAAQILYSLGQIPTIYSVGPELSTSGIQGRKRVYQLSFNPSIDFPTRVPRKKIRKLTAQKRIGIVGIEKINGEQGNCIQVEGGIYLVGEMPVMTHNSQGSSRNLPAYMLGRNPDLKIGLASYAATIATDFNRDVQRIIDSEEYHAIFPGSVLNESNVVTVSGNYLRNSEVFEIVGHRGSFRVVGRGGSLTSKTLDVGILDDLYKDAQEANSPIVRQRAWDWYTKVFLTRLHNESQQLIVFTRWHKDDIIGRILDTQPYKEIKTWQDLETANPDDWAVVNYEAIKMGEPTEIDARQEGESLWEGRHSLERLQAQRAIDPVGFQCLYQGNPGSAEGRLYQPFKTWIERDEWGKYVRSGNYTDVADEGNDFLCSICYDIYVSENQAWNENKRRFEPIVYALVTDIEYTDANTDITTISVPAMLNRNGTQKAWIESNNGGSQFEKVVKKKVKAITIPFYQGANKESRIITNAPLVNQSVIMPFGWEERYPKFYAGVTEFLREFTANAHDDEADALTGIYEKEIADGNLQPYTAHNRGIRVH